MKNKGIIVVLSILAIVLVTLAVVGKKKGWYGKTAALKVAVEVASNRNITEIVTASGKIYPETEVKISPDVSGEIVELYVQEGDTVKKGQLLARIRPDSYEAFLEQNDANVSNSKANLATTRARQKQVESQLQGTKLTYDRAKVLYDKKTLSKAELENAETAYSSAKSELEAIKQSIIAAEYMVKGAEAAKKESKNNLNKTTIYSPMDGIVSILNIEKGEKVVGTLQMAGTEMMRIADFGDMEVRVDVSEAEISKVREGQYANIEVDAYPGKIFTGHVTKVASSSKGSSGFSISTDQATNFVVRVRIAKSSYAELEASIGRPFRPGMSATVDIQTNQASSVLTVPVQAVTTREDSTGRTNQQSEVVFVVENGKAIMKRVVTGIQDDINIQIIEGLSQGEKVITAPYGLLSRDLKNADAVEVVSKDVLYGIDEKK